MNRFEMPELVVSRFSAENIMTASGQEEKKFSIGNDAVSAGVINLIKADDETVQKWNEILQYKN